MKYHYVLTIEITELGSCTADDVIEVHPDFTRSEIYKHVVQRTTQRMLDAAQYRPDRVAPITRFWSLEPEMVGVQPAQPHL
ncbi:hypothetical protein [Streptomyces sp. NPDC017529]|uniref:hypothetical protein n=1 Tax=Streptomyces sp. NPDC017529 TaxID=3365000 RepID=UPI003798DE03